MIAIATTAEALSSVARSTGIAGYIPESGLSEAFLAQAVRRAVSFMAPCTSRELARAVARSFSGPFKEEELTERVADVIEELIVYGDILEMREPLDDVLGASRTFVLRPAPPCFVARPDGSVAIIGIAGEQPTPLTSELNSLLQHHGVLRILPRIDHSDVPATLAELGLLKLSERTWLRLPTSEAPAAYISEWERTLANEPVSSAIEGLQVLDTGTPPTFYKGRWGAPGRGQNGLFVARRPQKYGAPLWCIVSLSNGTLLRFKDLAVIGDRLRPFDIALRIQAALDAKTGKPQVFTLVSSDEGTTVMKFYSPLPSWCERKLAVAGTKSAASNCLFSFEIPSDQRDDLASFICDTLWMTEAKQ